jgi:hypothetical protein
LSTCSMGDRSLLASAVGDALPAGLAPEPGMGAPYAA